MHNSYFFYKALVGRLSQLLADSILVSSFSQEKDELILEFNNGSKSVFLRIIFSPELSIIVFPEKFRRARNNSAEIFPAALSGEFEDIRLIENERTFIISFKDDSLLIFQMHGSSGNIIFQQKNFREVFRKSVSAHKKDIEVFQGRHLDWSIDFFLKNQESILKEYFLFGKEIWKWLRLMGYDNLSPSGKHQLILKSLSLMDQSHFYLCRESGVPFFSLLPFDDVQDLGTDPINAINSFYQIWVRENAFHVLRKSLVKRIQPRISRFNQLLEKTSKRQAELSAGNDFREWADLIMAHLHTVNPGDEWLKAERFTMPGLTAEIRLKPELSPQKNAEIYYRKARNREEEMARLKDQLLKASADLEIEKERMKTIMECVDIDSLRIIENQLPDAHAGKQQTRRLPYLEFEYMDYKILVGRSSADNDELTFKISAKEDLWLHVRDAGGSHVVVRNQPGKVIPGPVIERAASLAAYYSKRKGEHLCPVAYTKRKYVRKRKGDAPGAVVIEQEKVLMVVPAS